MRQKILLISSVLGSLVVGYLFYQNYQLQKRISELANQSNTTKDGKPVADPFIAGPVKNRILKGYSEMSRCYQEYLGTSPKKKEGDVRIDWQITTSGKPVSPEVVVTDFNNKAFEACLTQRIGGWQFAEPLAGC